jgi:hypothetical protein
VAGQTSGAFDSLGRGLDGLGQSAAGLASGTAGHGSSTVDLASGPAGLGSDADGLGSCMIGGFETDPSIGDAFLASQASTTSGAQRKRRDASNKTVRDDEA